MAEIRPQKQQCDGENCLDCNGHGRRAKARMHLGQRGEKISVAGHRKRNAGPTHNRSIQRNQHRDGHARRHNAGAHAAEYVSHCIGRWPLGGGNGIRRQNILHRRIHQHIQEANRGHAGNQRDGNVSLRLLHFARDHVEIVPAVIGPQSRDQRRHEAGHAAFCSAEATCEICPASTHRTPSAETDRDNPNNDGDFQHREHQLKFASFLNSDVVQHGDEDGGGNGDDLSPGQRKGSSDDIGGEK